MVSRNWPDFVHSVQRVVALGVVASALTFVRGECQGWGEGYG